MEAGAARSAALVAIGTELILDGRQDTNGSWIAARLSDLGFDVTRRLLLPDDEAEIAAALRDLDGRTGVVVVTGGLGPTSDDLTREGLSRAFGLQLREDPTIHARIAERARSRGIRMSAWAARQAQVPATALVLDNRAGTAPGLLVSRPSGTRFFLIPGVPHEMEHLMTAEVLPRLQEAGTSRSTQAMQTSRFKVAGMAEAEVEEALEGLFVHGAGTPGALTLLASPGEISVILRSRHEAWLERAASAARARLGDRIFTEDLDEGLEHAVGRLMRQRSLTLASAESCTGGLLGQLITRVPGASEWYRQGWITYTNSSKTLSLGVDKEAIDSHGAVSAEVARSMAEAARALAGADFGIGITGVAGPGGGTAAKPVGLTFIAVAGAGGCAPRRFMLGGDRYTNRLFAARLALHLMRGELLASA